MGEKKLVPILILTDAKNSIQDKATVARLFRKNVSQTSHLALGTADNISAGIKYLGCEISDLRFLVLTSRCHSLTVQKEIAQWFPNIKAKFPPDSNVYEWIDLFSGDTEIRTASQ